MTQSMRLCFGLGIAVWISGSAFAGPPLTEPVDVSVTNPVLPVEVSNADPIPVSLGDQGTPFAHSFSCGQIPPSYSEACKPYVLPSNQRAVIEQMSGGCVSKGTNVVDVRIRTGTNSEYHSHSLPLGSVQTDTTDPAKKHYRFGGLMRVYADAGAQIQSGLSVDDISGTEYRCVWSISGLLITVP